MDEKLQRVKEKQGMLMQEENLEQSIISKQHDGDDDDDDDDDDHIHGGSTTVEEVMKLAAMAIELNLRLRSSDMPSNMQHHALRFTRSFLDSSPKTTPPNPSHLARALKKEFDSLYGAAWHCVAGKSFGSFVTHSPGGFVYFSIDSLSVLLFKTQVHLLIQPKLP